MVQLTGQAVHVGHGGEVLVHHVERLAPPRDLLCQRAQRRAHHALVDELAGGQALHVAACLREHAAGLERDDVGGGAADVDQHALSLRTTQLARCMQGGGEPVGRGDVFPQFGHSIAAAPAGIAGEELHR